VGLSKLTDTQLVILSAASQRDDRGVELPANIRGEAARKVVAKLIRAGLLEEVCAGGSLPVWRRDDDSGAMALRITKNGLAAIDVEDEAAAAPKETSVRDAPWKDCSGGTRIHNSLGSERGLTAMPRGPRGEKRPADVIGESCMCQFLQNSN
jgi:hypothetical protein